MVCDQKICGVKTCRHDGCVEKVMKQDLILSAGFAASNPNFNDHCRRLQVLRLARKRLGVWHDICRYNGQELLPSID